MYTWHKVKEIIYEKNFTVGTKTYILHHHLFFQLIGQRVLAFSESGYQKSDQVYYPTLFEQPQSSSEGLQGFLSNGYCYAKMIL